jgi:hypothetical protein
VFPVLALAGTILVFFDAGPIHDIGRCGSTMIWSRSVWRSPRPAELAATPGSDRRAARARY